MTDNRPEIQRHHDKAREHLAVAGDEARRHHQLVDAHQERHRQQMTAEQQPATPEATP